MNYLSHETEGIITKFSEHLYQNTKEPFEAYSDLIDCLRMRISETELPVLYDHFSIRQIRIIETFLNEE